MLRPLLSLALQRAINNSELACRVPPTLNILQPFRGRQHFVNKIGPLNLHEQRILLLLLWGLLRPLFTSELIHVFFAV